MATKEQITVYLKGNEGKVNNGVMTFVSYTNADRMKRAATAWGVCWLIAIVCIAIPIAHFFLVPGFAIAGPVLAFFRYRQLDKKEKVVGVCPYHNEETTLELEATDQLPKWVYCPVCNGSLQLVTRHAQGDEPSPA